MVKHNAKSVTKMRISQERFDLQTSNYAHSIPRESGENNFNKRDMCLGLKYHVMFVAVYVQNVRKNMFVGGLLVKSDIFFSSPVFLIISNKFIADFVSFIFLLKLVV